MNAIRKFALVFGLMICFVGVALAQAPRGVTPEDYFAFEFISDPNISPDGKRVIVSVIDEASGLMMAEGVTW